VSDLPDRKVLSQELWVDAETGLMLRIIGQGSLAI
jgi:hypothetical protein